MQECENRCTIYSSLLHDTHTAVLINTAVLILHYRTIYPTCISDVDDERFRAQLWKMKELLETQVKKERFWEIDEEFLLEIGTCIGELMFAKLKVKTEQA